MEVWNLEKTSPPEIRFRQSYHLDGFNILRLDKSPKEGMPPEKGKAQILSLELSNGKR